MKIGNISQKIIYVIYNVLREFVFTYKLYNIVSILMKLLQPFLI